MQYERRSFGNVHCNTEMLRFPDILLYDTLRLADNKYFFGILKREYRSKNGVRFENVFFVTVSHIINRRRAPIAKSPIFFVFVSPLSINM